MPTMSRRVSLSVLWVSTIERRWGMRREEGGRMVLQVADCTGAHRSADRDRARMIAAGPVLGLKAQEG